MHFTFLGRLYTTKFRNSRQISLFWNRRRVYNSMDCSYGYTACQNETGYLMYLDTFRIKIAIRLCCVWLKCPLIGRSEINNTLTSMIGSLPTPRSFSQIIIDSRATFAYINKCRLVNGKRYPSLWWNCHQLIWTKCNPMADMLQILANERWYMILYLKYHLEM